MFSLLLCFCLGLVFSQTFPTPIATNGFEAIFRVNNKLFTTAATFNGIAFNPSTVFQVVTAATEVVQSKTISTGLTAYESLDLRTSAQGQTTLSFRQSNATGNELCSVQINPNAARATIAISQTVTDNKSTGTCSVTTGMTTTTSQCTQDAPNTVSFTCTVETESLEPRSCSTVELDVFREDLGTCNYFLERTSAVTKTGEATILSDPFTPLASKLNVILDKAETYAFFSPVTNTGAALDGNARAYESRFLTTDANIQKYETGYLTVVNTAHRVNTTTNTNLENSFTVVVRRGSSSGAPVHCFESIAGNSVAAFNGNNFLELEAGAYNVAVYVDALNTCADILGTATVAPLIVGTFANSQVSVANGNFQAVVISTSSSPFTGFNIGVQTLYDGSSIVADSDTSFTVFNYVHQTPISLAGPSGDCCNILTGVGTIGFGSSFSTTSKSLETTFNNQRTYSVRTTAPICGGLSTGLGAVSFTDGASGSCRRKVIFVTGRTFTTTVNTGATCSAAGTCTVQETRIGGIDFVGTAGSGSLQTIELELPVCNCASATTATTCTTVADLCTAVADQDMKLTAIDSGVNSIETSLPNIGSSINTVSTQSQFTVSSLSTINQNLLALSQTDSGEARILRELSKIEDDLKEVGKDVDSAVDLAEDEESLLDDLADDIEDNQSQLVDVVNDARDVIVEALN